jgi:AcrR family transcriptional regulator
MLASVSAVIQKRLPRAVREQQMLAAATAVFASSGFHGASMDEIAARAGISKPMVYAYLGSKEELFVACLHRAGTAMMEAVAQAVGPDLPADEQLWRGLLAFFTCVDEQRDGWLVLYRQARGQEPFATELARMRAQMVQVVEGVLARAVTAAGQRARPVELTSMAISLVGAGESLADWAVDQDAQPAEVTATRLMNFVWLGAAELLRGATWRPAGDTRAGHRRDGDLPG